MKKLCAIILLTASVALCAMEDKEENPFFIKIDKSGSKERAFERMKKAQYPIVSMDQLSRVQGKVQGKPCANAGFHEAKLEFDGTVNRVIYYDFFPEDNVGEGVAPHYHNENEIFKITLGGCKVGLFQDEKWKVFIKEKGQIIEIPAGVIHCLVVNHPDGLCMHISRDDSTRGVEFVNIDFPSE